MKSQKTTIQTPYNIAFRLLVSGFSVIPAGENKAPSVPWVARQVTPAAEAELETWEAGLKPPLWGIVTGAVSGVVVVDADDAPSRAILENKGLEPHIITPRGGGHYYFKHPGKPIKTCVGLLPHLDIRADGGYCNVVGKSKLGEYKIIKLPAQDNLYPFSELPAEIVKAMTAPSELTTKPAEPMIEGQRNSRLTSIAGAMRRQGTDQEAITTALLAINEAQCQPPLPDTEVKAIAKSTSRYTPQPTPEPKEEAPDNGHRPELKTLVKVKAETVRWLWEPYIPLEKLTLIEGDPGVGKSWLTLAIMSAVSLGRGLPHLENTPHGPCLLASAEDGIADTIKPRLSAMGADTRIITAIDGLFTLDDAGFEWLEETIFNLEPLPVLFVIDPLVAYLSATLDLNKANQARYATARLAHIADKYSIAIIAVRHLTKGGSQKPIYRGLGSIDYVASARSVLLAGEDPDPPHERAFVHIKSNLAEKGRAVGYDLRDSNFYWLDETNLTPEILLGTAESGSSPSGEAREFILTTLATGPKQASDIWEEAKARLISEATLKRAKSDIGIITYREGAQGKKGGGQWVWKLPEGD